MEKSVYVSAWNKESLQSRNTILQNDELLYCNDIKSEKRYKQGDGKSLISELTFPEEPEKGNKMAEIKIEQGHGIIYECSECGHDVELGQNYCQECGEPIEWREDYE